MPTYDQPLFLLTNTLFGSKWGYRYVLCQPASVSDWETPFFFEDRRNVFYVTTTLAQVTIFSFSGFGMQGSWTIAANLAPLVFPHPLKVQAQPDVILAGNVVGGSPTIVQRSFTYNANVRAAIGSTMPVSYQGRQISLSESSASLSPAAAASNKDA